MQFQLLCENVVNNAVLNYSTVPKLLPTFLFVLCTREPGQFFVSCAITYYVWVYV